MYGRIVVTGSPDQLKAELRGDAVHIELRDEGDDHAKAALGNVPGVREVTLAGRHLSARADDGAAAVPHALAALDKAGTPAATVTVARPSLDDVYLRYAGRRFEEAERAVKRGAIMNANVIEQALSTTIQSLIIVELMPGWMRTLTTYNPVNWAVEAARSALTENPDRGEVVKPGAALLVLAVLTVWLSTRTFRTYQKSV